MIKGSEARAQEMFYTACGFAKCADYALENPAKEIVPNLSTASFVNTAFACELFLKALLLHWNIEFKKEHKLKPLFELLPEEYQKEVEQAVFYKCGGSVKTLWGEPLLDKVSNAFVEWRYWFEPRKINGRLVYPATMTADISYLQNFRDALKALCEKVMFGGLKGGGFYGTIG